MRNATGVPPHRKRHTQTNVVGWPSECGIVVYILYIFALHRERMPIIWCCASCVVYAYYYILFCAMLRHTRIYGLHGPGTFTLCGPWDPFVGRRRRPARFDLNVLMRLRILTTT